MLPAMLRFRMVLGVLAVALVACGDDGSNEGGSGGPGVVVATGRVGAAGGRLVTDDGALELRIPAAALAEETQITVKRLAAADWPGDTVVSPPLGDAVYELLPDGLRFEQPVQVVHRPSAADLAAGEGGRFPAASHVSRAKAGDFERSPTTVVYERSGAASIVGTIEHFSTHWATVGTEYGDIALLLDRDESGVAPLEGSYGVYMMGLVSSDPGPHEFDFIAGAYASAPAIAQPEVFEDWSVVADMTAIDDVFTALETNERPIAGARSAPYPVKLEGLDPMSLGLYCPAFTCAEEGESTIWYEFTFVDAGVTVIVEDHLTCMSVP